MKLTCPNCNFSRDIPEQKIPSQATRATCPKCKHKFIFRQLDKEKNKTDKASIANQVFLASQKEKESDQVLTSQAELKDKIQEQDLWEEVAKFNESPEEKNQIELSDLEEKGGGDTTKDVPWETLEEYGFFPGMFLTIKQVMFAPSSFFKQMQLKGYGKPLVFYLLLAEVQAVFVFIWQMIGLSYAPPAEQNLMGWGVVGAGGMLVLLFYPLILALALFLGAGLNHLLLKAVGAANKGFEATFRAITYSSAPMVLSVIPVLGQMIGALWAMTIQFIALKNIHDTSYMRVFLGLVVLPLTLVLILAVGMYLLS